MLSDDTVPALMARGVRGARFMRELTSTIRVVVVGVLLLTGCSGSSTAPAGTAAATRPPAAATAPAAGGGGAQAPTINMTDGYQFQPATLTVPRGTTVTWTNAGQQPHSVTDDASKAANRGDAQLPNGAQPWDSGLLEAGKTFTHTFDTPGEYTYFCMPHEALGMIAHITVSG
jgi:plastocyanin